MPDEDAPSNGVPNHGDMTQFQEWPDHDIDLLVGGTPCQDGSIGYAAGTGRAGDGFGGGRTGLAWTYQRIIERYRPLNFVWENVPNLLTKRHAGDFLAFAAGFTKFGYSVGWRVIDMAGFGPSDQPRNRIIMVGSGRGEKAVHEILFECQGDPGDFQTPANAAPVLTRRGAMAFDDRTPCILDGGRARIATPLEWERAMGFPDNHTRIPWRGKPADQCPDTPRYRAIGNSMSVDLMRWIGRRIEMVEAGYL